MPTNDFLPFAIAPGANVATQPQWIADPAVPEGFISGVLPSAKANKVLRQASFVAAAVAEVMLQTLGIDVLDDGNLGVFAARLSSTISALGGGEGSTGAVPEAPSDGQQYGRGSLVWLPVIKKGGDTMTGPLLLAADPTAALGAATKQYVDGVGTIAASAVQRAGDAMTGPLALPADPTANLQAATKQYVDAVRSFAAATYLARAGGTMTGALLLAADPSVALGAATKQYVDGVIGAAGGPFLALAGGTITGPVITTAAGPSIYSTNWFVVNRGSAPQNPFSGAVFQGIGADGSTGRLAVDTFNTSANNGSNLSLRTGRGTSGASFGTTLNNDELGRITFVGCYAANSFAGTNAQSTMVRGFASEDWTATSAASRIEIWARATGTLNGHLVASFDGNSGLLLVADPTAALGAVTKQYTDAADALRAPLASPALTGTPTAPTAAPGTNTTQLATTAFVTAAAALYLPLTGGSLSAALTIAAGGLAIAAGGLGVTGAALFNNTATFTGTATFNGNVNFAAASTPTWPTAPSSGNQLANKTYVDGQVALYLPLAGGTLSGTLIQNGNAANLPVASGYNIRAGSADGSYTRFVADAFLGGTAQNGAWSQLALRFARGTAAAPTPPQLGDDLGRLSWIAPTSAGYQGLNTNATMIRALANENWGTGTAASRIEVWTQASGSATGLLSATFDTVNGLSVANGLGFLAALNLDSAPVLPTYGYGYNASIPDGSAGNFQATCFGNGTVFFIGGRAPGTATAPTALTANAGIVNFGAIGYDGSAWSSTRGSIQIASSNAWVSGDTSTRIRFLVTPAAAAAQALVGAFNMDGTLYVGSSNNVSSNNTGAGTVNADNGFYVNTRKQLRTVAAPATATSTGVAGDAAWASGFFYICIATNSWQRVAIAAW